MDIINQTVDIIYQKVRYNKSDGGYIISESRYNKSDGGYIISESRYNKSDGGQKVDIINQIRQWI